jgi:hypothetical protein
MRTLSSRSSILIFVCLLVVHIGVAQTNSGKPPAKKTTTTTQSPTPNSPGPSSAPVANGVLSKPASQGPSHTAEEFPADYIPCVFTLHELLGLRLTPIAATLTSGEAEDLKERLISEATTQANNGAMDPNTKSDFLGQIANEPLEGLTPSQALARVIAILRNVNDERIPIDQLEYAASHQPLDQLTNVVKSQLSGLPTDATEAQRLDKNLSSNLTDSMSPADKLTQLANNVSALQTGLQFYYSELEATQKPLARNLLKAAKESETSQLTGAERQKAETDLQNQSNQQDVAIRAIVESARAAIAVAFQRPQDVGCAMSILSYNETRYAFGSIVANEYVAVQVVVRNLNDKQEFALHDAELSVDTDINGRYGRFYSGRDKLIVRGVSLAQADFTVRNLTVNIATAVGTIMSAALPIAGTAFKDATGVYNGGFIPGLKSSWADHSIDQLNLLSDIGFSSSTNYKTVVPKSGSVMFVIFVPSKQFEEGWWVQSCAQHIVISPPTSGNSQSAGTSKKGLGATPPAPPANPAPEDVGIDLGAARTMCRTFGKIDTPPAQNKPAPVVSNSSNTAASNQANNQPSNAGNVENSSNVGNVETTATGKPPAPNSASPAPPSSSVFLSVDQVRYRNWSPTSLAIFRELTWAVVAGTHIQQTQNTSTITELKCPTDDVGNIVLGKTSSISCDVTGESLDKIAVLRLENAQDATDTDTADGTVTVSGDPTKAKVTFQVSKLGNLTKSAYKVYAVTTTGVESFANQTLHLSFNPFESDLNPTSMDPNKQASTQFTVKGFHLDKVDKIELFEGSYSKTAKPLLQYPPDTGASANQLSFTIKSTDDDLKAKASGTSGSELGVAFTVKNSSTVIPADSIKLQSTSGAAAAGASFSLKSLAFGQQNVGSATSKDLQLAASASELTGLSVEITGTDAKVFAVTNSCSSTLAAKDKCTISVKFAPKTAGQFTANLEASYNSGGSKETQSVSITGKSVAKASDGVSLTPNNLNFGTQTKGTASDAKVVTITNSGTAPLSGCDAALSGPNSNNFSQSGHCGGVLQVGQKCELQIIFKPTIIGSLSATLRVTYLISDKKSTQTLRIVGTGKE